MRPGGVLGEAARLHGIDLDQIVAGGSDRRVLMLENCAGSAP
jgi:hypothetical protein